MDGFVNRRVFLKSGAAVGAAGCALAGAGRPIGPNDRIAVGVVGAGPRGLYLARQFTRLGESTGACKVVAVCDVYEKRRRAAAEEFKCDSFLDYRELVNRSDIDAVVVATPDHWHARIALDAMARGKDVYGEKPMAHTIEEAKRLVAAVRRQKRVFQVGSQTTSAAHWHKTRQYILDGAIGDMIMSQGSRHGNSIEGVWNGSDWAINPDAGPTGKGENYVDWKMWLGPAPSRPFNSDRFFRFRKYWDYSGGIATDLLFHLVAPLNICWPEPQFPRRVVASGGIYCFKDGREVPDTFHIMAEFPKGHSMVLTSTYGNAQHVPGTIRGRMGTIVMLDHGMFESPTDHITLIPERRVITDAYKKKFGDTPRRIETGRSDAIALHIGNFLNCMRTRQKPTLDVETALRVQVTVSMAVQSYREGRVLYWDEKAMKVTSKPNV